MQKVKDFLLQSYHSDHVAFYNEFISFLFTVGASLTLALSADAPDMRIVYPGFFVGSVFGTYAYYRRGLAWPMLLTKYFMVVNVIGFGRAMLWW